MSLYEILTNSWGPPASPLPVAAALEEGLIAFLPRLRFEIEADESRVMTPVILNGAKNASFEPTTGRLGGIRLPPADKELLAGMMRRFSAAAASLIKGLLPEYRTVAVGRASFRPAEIAGRPSSWRKDDTRLHVDSFPATPSGGRRILRVFTNVNPVGRPRSWRVGCDFAAVAERFASKLRVPVAGSGRVLALLRVTRTPRTAYDGLMLQLHDAMKADDEFQRTSRQEAVDFPAGSTWIAFTDAVSHAATAGQYQFEQTFLVEVGEMLDEARSPLRVLERIKGRRLV